MIINKEDIAEKYLIESEKFSERVLEQLDKTDLKEKVKKKCYDALMENEFVADIVDTLADKYNALLDKNKKLLSEVNKEGVSDTIKKHTYNLVIANRRTMEYIKKEKRQWEKYSEETYERAVYAKSFIEKRIEKLEKKANKRR